jgi:hypothetical protein
MDDDFIPEDGGQEGYFDGDLGKWVSFNGTKRKSNKADWVRKTHKLPSGQMSIDEYCELEYDWNQPPILDLALTKVGTGTKIKKGVVNGVHFDSKWEYCFWLWEHNINGKPCERNTTETIDYVDENGQPRKWIPDFKVVEGYAEVKGFNTATDDCKRNQHPEVKWYGADIMPSIVSAVEKVYPNWKKDYIEL